MNQHDEDVADLKNDNEHLKNQTEHLKNQTEHLKNDNEKSQEETEKLSKKVENLNEKLQNETEKLSKKVENLNEKLQNETEKLSKKVENLNEKSQEGIENLNQTIQLILKFSRFLFDVNCDSKECLLCKIGWTSFSDSCYFFSNVYLTWNESRLFCQNKSADLVVVDNLQEQKFIYNNTKTEHWLGLRKVGSDWVWIDGRNDTLRFWASYYHGESYASIYPTGNLTASWVTAPNINLYNISIFCEQKAFKVSLN